MPLGGDSCGWFFLFPYLFIFLFFHICVESVDDILLPCSVEDEATDKNESTAEECNRHLWTKKNAAMPRRQGSITL
jgi:hypothetical protein